MQFDFDDNSDVIYIPACPPIQPRQSYDPRDPEAGVRTYRKQETQVTFENGDVRIHCYLNFPPIGKGALRVLWKKYSAQDRVRSITLMLNQTVSSTPEIWNWLLRNGFRRDICRERRDDVAFAFVREFPEPTQSCTTIGLRSE